MKIRVARVRKKPYLNWQDAQRIVNDCKQPYRSAFGFLLWSGLGLDEFAEIQESAEIQADIEKQRGNDKPYIRINLRPRKSNLDTYYTLVPKLHVPHFPLLTLNYGNRGGRQISANDLEMYWQRATERVGMRVTGLGPHSLRSAFRSQCAKVGVADAIAEYQMGHGGGDKYGYRREVADETYVAAELSKLWKGTAPVTSAELDERDRQIAKLREDLENMKKLAAGPIAYQSLKEEQGLLRIVKDQSRRIDELEAEVDRQRGAQPDRETDR